MASRTAPRVAGTPAKRARKETVPPDAAPGETPFVQVSVSTDELLNKIGRLTMEKEKVDQINGTLAGEIARLRAVCEKHDVDPDGAL